MRRAVLTSVALAVVTLAGCSGGNGVAGGSGDPRPSSAAPSPAQKVTGPRSFLYLVPPSGGAPRALLSPSQAARLVAVADPVWSPDGRRIAFTAGCPSCTPRLYVVSATGTNLHEIPTGPDGVHSPSWSPRGNAIVFARQRGEEQFIATVSLRSDRVRLVNTEPDGADNTDSTPPGRPTAAGSSLPGSSTTRTSPCG